MKIADLEIPSRWDLAVKTVGATPARASPSADRFRRRAAGLDLAPQRRGLRAGAPMRFRNMNLSRTKNVAYIGGGAAFVVFALLAAAASPLAPICRWLLAAEASETGDLSALGFLSRGCLRGLGPPDMVATGGRRVRGAKELQRDGGSSHDAARRRYFC